MLDIISLFSLLPLNPLLFSSSSACPSLTIGELFIGVGSPLLTLDPRSHHPMSVLLYAASRISTFHISTFIPDLYFSIPHHYISQKKKKNLILRGITACYCYLCKTRAVPHKQKENKLAIATCLIRKNAVTDKPGKTKLWEVKKSSDRAGPPSLSPEALQTQCKA